MTGPVTPQLTPCESTPLRKGPTERRARPHRAPASQSARQGQAGRDLGETKGSPGDGLFTVHLGGLHLSAQHMRHPGPGSLSTPTRKHQPWLGMAGLLPGPWAKHQTWEQLILKHRAHSKWARFCISRKEEAGRRAFGQLPPRPSVRPTGRLWAPQGPNQPCSPPPVHLLQLRLLLLRELLQLQPLAGPQLGQLSLDLPILLLRGRQPVSELLAKDLGQAAALASQLLVHLGTQGRQGPCERQRGLGAGAGPLSRRLTAFMSASSFSFCRTRACRRTFSPSASPRRPFSSVHRSWSFRSDCSSSESSASYLSRTRLTLAARGTGSGAAPGPASAGLWGLRPHRLSAALSLSSLARVMSASSRWMTSSISLSRPLRISSFSSRSRFSSHASWRGSVGGSVGLAEGCRWPGRPRGLPDAPTAEREGPRPAPGPTCPQDPAWGTAGAGEGSGSPAWGFSHTQDPGPRAGEAESAARQTLIKGTSSLAEGGAGAPASGESSLGGKPGDVHQA